MHRPLLRIALLYRKERFIDVVYIMLRETVRPPNCCHEIST